MLIRSRIDSELDEQFPELAQNPIAKTDVVNVLVWRDLRLRDFLDFAIILEEMGGIDEFADYDFQMKKSALVNHPSDTASLSSLIPRPKKTWTSRYRTTNSLSRTFYISTCR